MRNLHVINWLLTRPVDFHFFGNLEDIARVYDKNVFKETAMIKRSCQWWYYFVSTGKVTIVSVLL